MAEERLQKVLARAGYGSRRKCETYITAGRVTVDGHAVTELGAKADPERQDVRLDGEPVKPENLIYYAVYKPIGAVSTTDDPEGRPTVVDLLPGVEQRLFVVGRLDVNSEGLVLLTNDGEFANRAMHPSYEVPKTYEADIRGELSPEARRALRAGVVVEGRPVTVEKMRTRRRGRDRTTVTLTIHEGRKRVVRRLLNSLGHPVVALKRTHIGPIGLDRLRPGSYRRVGADEVQALLKMSRRSSTGGPHRKQRRGKGKRRR